MSGKRILVVDDENIVRISCKKILSTEGFEVDLAADGYEAIELIKKQNYDVIITDLKMPKMDGLEVLQWIKKNSPASKIIVITGFSTPDIAEKSIAYGAIRYLEKPFTPEILLSAVRSVINE
ncbi:MAG: response regulator [Thermodesulfovibrionales bacterium]|nr:response regulator [Thermodesulfovibrionales bacterium]